MNMKYLLLFVTLAFTFVHRSNAQEYTFQNTTLSDDERLDNLISLMTLEEKISNLSPRPAGVPRLGVQGTRIVEGLHGLALSGPANWAVKGEGAAPTTTFPQAYGLAQTWDPELHQRLGAWEAEEIRYLTQNENYKSAGLIILAPNADLGRDIRWGRTEECYGEDAYLASRMTVAYVKGLQGEDEKYWKSAALMKHFLANSNENDRMTNSSDFDDRLFREYYSYPFYKGIVEGGSRAFMAAYNKYNGIPCAVHPMLDNIAVKEWGQNGIICTDGGAYSQLINAHKYYDTFAEAAAACIDSGITMFLDRYQEGVQAALDEKLIDEKDIDRAVKGTLRVMLKLGLMDKGQNNPYLKIGVEDTVRPWKKPEARVLAREATVKSVVLMKNDGILPLNKQEIKSIAVIGPSADFVVSDWYAGTPPYKVSVLEGIKHAVGDDVKINFAASNQADSAVIAAKNSEVAIVCIGNHPLSYGLDWGENHVYSDGREAIDRQAISLEQEDLAKLVKAANPNTVLVLVSSFPYAINWSKEHIPAILHVTQSSQELGNGVADVLFGDVSPAGRLVQTWSASIDELPPILEYNIRNGKTYLYDEHEPLFAFGHGLSYATFTYSNLKLDKKNIKKGDELMVSIDVKNESNIDSDEVVQVYASFPDSKVERPKKALKAFRRVHIPAGTTKTVTIPLDTDELNYWNVEKHQFVLEPGKINLMVGASSVDIRAEISVNAK